MKLLFDTFPLLILFAVYKFYDIYTAIVATIIALIIQVGLYWIKYRRFETIHLITLVITVLLGGLTIVLQNDYFFKWKPSVINWLFALIIIAMLIFGKKSALEYLMDSTLNLAKPIWIKINLAWAIFFIFIGLLNLYVAFYYNISATAEARMDTWMDFKIFGIMGMILVFSIAQAIYLSKYIKQE